MTGFVERTGLSAPGLPVRYLWTDALAVCNLLGLAQATGHARYTDLALGLVDQVHHVLGRHRADDARSGWLSGLGREEGEAHPTWGGLRIGKPLPERLPGAPADEVTEWSRDGQYFHYLTRWMHALNQVAVATGNPQFNAWARELAGVAQGAFVYGVPGQRRMVWKMSLDLSRPLVTSMGQHDPLDGFVTCLELRATASVLADVPEAPRLEETTADFEAMCVEGNWTTADPLGLGGLLTDALRLAQLARDGFVRDGDLLCELLAAAEEGLAAYERHGDLEQPAHRRLPFRELGLAIGLAALAPIGEAVRVHAPPAHGGVRRIQAALDALAPYRALGDAIESFWAAPEHRRGAWSEHQDINDVMLATRLVPEGFFGLQRAGVRRTSAA
jgi:hypothetical protein